MTVLPPAAPGCASCAARDELIAEQGQAIGELKADVLALAEEVRELRRRLGRNSGFSSMAPSADDLPGRTPPEQKPAHRVLPTEDRRPALASAWMPTSATSPSRRTYSGGDLIGH